MTGYHEELGKRKRELRTRLAAARGKLSPEQRSRLSALACSHALAWLESEGISSLLAYVSFRSELDTRPLIMQAWEGQREVLLPRVIPGSGAMALHRIQSWEELAPGAYGIPEPVASGEDAELSAVHPLPAAVFVPGLAFDSRGGRLGYGRGYYDRLRASWETALPGEISPPVWIGLAYGMQLVDEVPMDDHDAFMDMLITENGILYCRKGE